ncbi:hypothetical protein [Leifsonia sp. EB34]|uniref:hypothetical protein n=1 Tax=Leifsonia sp. EB34 TaxID=3156303 RepID=UPI003515E722
MNVEPDSLEHLYLNMGGGDWLSIRAVNYEAKAFEPDEVKRKALVLSTMRSLAEAGYFRIGQVRGIDPEEPAIAFFEWPGTLDEQIERLNGVYMPEGRDDTDWAWLCMFDLTEEGERLEESLPPLDERFFD